MCDSDLMELGPNVVVKKVDDGETVAKERVSGSFHRHPKVSTAGAYIKVMMSQTRVIPYECRIQVKRLSGRMTMW